MTRQPLSAEERATVYEAQVWIRAVKLCTRCGRTLPVHLYDGHGAQPCEPCRRELAFDRQRAGSLGRWRTG